MPHGSHPGAHRPPLALHGVPLDIGAGRRGASLGPAALRLAGLAGHLTELGHRVADMGDARIDDGTALLIPAPALADAAARHETVMAYARCISDRAQGSLAGGALPVFLGGDHSLSMGSVAGVARHCAATGRPLFVLWFDAHADFNTPDISPSGNPHGMSLALLCGEPQFSGVISPSWHAPVEAGHVTILGARSIDRDERRLLAERGVEVADMRMIDETGIAGPLRRVLERVGEAHGHLHVSFDLDVMDPSLAPGVGTPVPGGLTYREAHLAMEMLHDSGLVGSLDLVELNPMLDLAGRSADLLVDLTGSLFGRRIVDRPARP
ncbi:arginase [Azorhizobium doebereinerae]|uniref:arginase n=1 Tax=Azorhizobium doebereinerae TaxID=281091 RepID=UPI000403E797|nr:arginase [Azorhizobium doebereinerae]